MRSTLRKIPAILFLISLAIFSASFAHPLRAATADEIQAQIDDHNKQIEALNEEISKYQAQLDVLGKQKTTLQTTINSLTTSAQKITANLKVTQNQIGSANLKINQLALQIDDKQQSITADHAAVAESLRRINESEADTLVEQLFSTGTLADAWRARDASAQFTAALKGHVYDLASAKAALAENLGQVRATQAKLVELKNELTTQQHSLAVSTAAQKTLLTQTQSQESTYQQLIATKKAQQAAFESELIMLADQLKLAVDPSHLPTVGAGVLSWPFSATFMQNCAARTKVFGNADCITQYFGNTAFSTANSQIYNGHGHNAIDIGAPIGTPVLSALGGTVKGTGNTDAVPGCYSFGKWVMIDHPNGISTLYAHLSEIDVSKGQAVTRGQQLGYSGMTGYATGPHLHFGVYATQGTQIMTLQQFRGAVTPCANATMPVAAIDAYLNPLSYL
ncbi:MAG: peptidoglycan DD-metalloendopeptidase family protein [bacterium]